MQDWLDSDGGRVISRVLGRRPLVGVCRWACQGVLVCADAYRRAYIPALMRAGACARPR